MGWARLDDGFDDHPKVLAILDEDDTPTAGTAIGLWALCLAWANRNTRKRGKVPGLLPAGMPRRYFGRYGKDAAQLLVKHHLWEPQDDGGWLIHDFGDFLPTETTSQARAEAGRRGAAKRWGNRPKTSADVANDGSEPSEDGKLPSGCHDDDGNTTANDGSRAHARRAISKEIASPTHTQAQSQSQETSSEADASVVGAVVSRPDVELICSHLANRIEENGSKRPTVTDAWRTSARLLIDRDRRTVDQITKAIDWCQNDDFWRANILSMPTLRKQYDRLRLAAQKLNGNGNGPSPGHDGRRVSTEQELLTGGRPHEVLY